MVPEAVPTPPPTAAPMRMPTPAPSLDCASGETIYRLWMYDSGGDGWQGATWVIYDATMTYPLLGGTLGDGYSSRECVDHRALPRILRV